MTYTWDYDWTFPKALLFTITIMTTVGYGHISPDTISGKLFCMLYAIVGIPLLLVLSAKIGDLMADGFRWMYRYAPHFHSNISIIIDFVIINNIVECAVDGVE